MTSNHLGTTGIQILGLASDSLIMTFLISGVVAFVIFLIISLTERIWQSDTRGFFGRKRVLVSGIAFIISLVVVTSAGPVPMAYYHGIHEKNLSDTEGEVAYFTVYYGEMYSHGINFIASCDLDDLETVTVFLDFYSNDTAVAHNTFEIIGSMFEQNLTGQVFTALEPGAYRIEFSMTYYYNGTIGSLHPELYNIILSQPLGSGMLGEVAEWDVYRLVFLITSIAFILVGIYFDRGSFTKITKDNFDDMHETQGVVYEEGQGDAGL